MVFVILLKGILNMQNEAYIQRTYKKFEKVLEFYAAHIFRTVAAAENVLSYETQEHLRKPPKISEMTPIAPGTTWGKEYGNMWLRTSFCVPETLAGQQLCVIPDVQAVEILCFKNEVPAGIINSKNDFLGGNHSAMFLQESAVPGAEIDVALECYAGHDCPGTQPYDRYDREEPDPEEFIHKYEGIRLCVLDKVFRDFAFDAATVLQLANLPEDNFTRVKAHNCLMKAFPYLIQDIHQASVDELRESAEIMSQILAPALEKGCADRSRGKLMLVGHSHMDTAWLWPVEETIRKCARTYSQALTLMDLYPEYTFIQSSVLHLDWMREYYPDIFEGIKKRVAEGRYEPNGGVWVECDCNITGGESMIRQFLYGQRYTMEHLNYRADSFWLPDTFGYSAAIPQIMLGCGVKYFYTTKMDWGDLNKFPAHSFRWRGLDGSEVLSHLNRIHFIPDIQSLNIVINGLVDKRSCDIRLGAYGYGDGGGGPTYGMLEFMKRSKDLDGMPEIEYGNAGLFMKQLEKTRDTLPIYDGELYLELHRGTLTQMHQVKKNNRIAETGMHNMELLNVLSGEPCSKKRDALYKVILKNQFHDIIPGTCIQRVYDIAIPEMENVIRQIHRETIQYTDSMTEAKDNVISVYNPLSFSRNDTVSLDGALTFENAVSQIYTDHSGNTKTAVQISIPAMDTAILKLGTPIPVENSFIVEGNNLETPFYKASFDNAGYIATLTDKEADRLISRDDGVPLGTLWFGEDMSYAWDNWDIDDDVFCKLKPVTDLISREVISIGAVEYRVRSCYKLGRHSKISVDTVFYTNSRRIDFDVQVDWHEHHALLKAGFDVNIRTAFAKNEIQFGHIDRPTTRNSALEAAKFEVCNHKWTDLSETRYGVALLNDCKYGISIDGSDMRLTLHKGGMRPDPVTDNGIHTMTYSLLPHLGAFNAENVIHPAYELNYAPLTAKGALNVPKLFSLSHPGIICETVKTAEDIENAFVLRLYEAERNNSNCTLEVNNVKEAWLTNMLEEKQEQLNIIDGKIKLNFRPFEIKTILIQR